ncbi:MAG: TIR domain-containing protein [Spirochaetaceae bacterium]|nr:TIR domain-containing protein [Spirochaetaceae bacterium]
MANKIFVSYKYDDNNVCAINSGNPLNNISNPTTVRTYVDKLEEYFDATEFAIYKGESDDEDLSHLRDDEIWEKLKDRIFDSTVTIVMISPKMKEARKSDKSQWIPWEISFSLKETKRNDKTSHSNAILAVVLPDRNNSYSYFEKDEVFPNLHNNNILFKIMRKNMFNRKKMAGVCEIKLTERLCRCNDFSYIQSVYWPSFTNNVKSFIDKAVEIKNNIREYDIKTAI